MKFHHLARHNHFVAAAAQQQARDLSPSKQQASKQNNMSDDEEDDFINESQQGNFHDAPDQQQQQQQQQQQPSNSSHSTSASIHHHHDTNSFLMDKNKKLFPQKLWELIHNPSIQHCLRWSQDGQRVYLNRNEFEAYYLKTPNNQFHTQKAISFVRQMNMYGFRKVDDCYYENDNFRRDRQHLLRNMIRRHPNKGLFVGLDHHQLAAAAAAQQALQVNQQLQQLENQHKHRTEQALRLNSYLNNHHQFQTNLALHHHSSQFEQMSTQLAQAAANHLSQQQQQQQLNSNHQQLATAINLNQQQQQQQQANSNQSLAAIHHQPKKSRLLNNFYANSSATSNNNHQNIGLVNANNSIINRNGVSGAESKQVSNHQQLISQQHNQDSMHSNSSVDTQPSQCSSVVNSGSAGSPQPNSPRAILHQQQRISISHNGLANNRHHHLKSSNTNNNSSSAIRAAVLAAAAAAAANQQQQQQQQPVDTIASKFTSSATNGSSQHTATDLSQNNHQLASRQAALHETLVRSLLQLKHHHQPSQDLLASLQQQQQNNIHPRSLLESLASLSSAGTGSIVDPTSNSPTERTATPPSSPPTPSLLIGANGMIMSKYDEASAYHCIDTGALNLAKSSINLKHKHEDDEFSIDVEEDETEIEDEFARQQRRRKRRMMLQEDEKNSMERNDDNHEDEDDDDDKSPLDAARKVRRFLNNQMPTRIKRESSDDDDGSQDEQHVKRKRIQLSNDNSSNHNDELNNAASIAKSLVLEICDRRNDRLEISALNEAARLTECFLNILLENAAQIAAKPNIAEVKTNDEENGEVCELKDGGIIVDNSSLLLALKLIPSKLLEAIQPEQQQPQQSDNSNEATTTC